MSSRYVAFFLILFMTGFVIPIGYAQQGQSSQPSLAPMTVVVFNKTLASVVYGVAVQSDEEPNWEPQNLQTGYNMTYNEVTNPLLILVTTVGCSTPVYQLQGTKRYQFVTDTAGCIILQEITAN